jgi:hypothetical protein
MKKCTNFVAAALLAVAIFSGTSLKAQTTTESPWRLGIGVEYGQPTGNLRHIFEGEYGGNIRLQYMASPGLGIMLTSGYDNFFGGNKMNTATTFGNTTYATDEHNLGIVPVKVGVKGFFAKGMYVSAEGGVGFETGYNEDKKLILSPGLGWADTSWDIGLRYENFSGQNNNYGLVGLRVAYGFGL